MNDKFTITITLENGKVMVNGPMENKILCYGLLELAKDIIRSHQPSPIIKPPVMKRPMA